MLHQLRHFRIILFLAGVVFLLSTSYAFADREVINSGGHKSRKQITVTMVAPPVLAMGQPLELTVTIQPLIDAPDVALRWGLPPGVSLLDGPVEERLGSLVAGQIVTLKRQVRIDSEGTFKIGVEATFQPNPAAVFGDAGILYFTVDESGGSVSIGDPMWEAKLREQIPFGPDASVTVSEVSVQPDATDDTCFSVFATLMRKDKAWDGTAQVTNIIPLTGVYIEIWEDDLIFNDLMTAMFPNAQGEISYSACDDDGLFDDDLEIFIAVPALAQGEEGPVIAALESSPPLWIDLPDVPFTDDGLYVFETGNKGASSDGTVLNFGTLELNDEMSGAINIVESIFEAWQFWNDNDLDPGRTEYDIVDVYWSQDGGYGSYYVSFLDNLHLIGAPDSDEWDDSVIIHEWGHFADDKWGCDENPGGEHFVDGIVDSELAWGEGYPDYYQSVVRAASGELVPHIYADLNGMGGCGVCVNLEAWDVQFSHALSPNNEFSIAASLWDLIDTNNDGQDMYTMAEGYPFIEKVFLNSDFGDIGGGSCNFVDYLKLWQKLGGPTDAGAAAAIAQNTNLTDVFTNAASVASTQSTAQALEPNPGEYGWWERVSYIVDNSQSMAGDRLNAIKTVLQEQVDDLFATETEGVELRLDTFNNTSATNQTVFTGQFYPQNIKPAIAGLSPTATADGACPVDAFGALKQTVAGESNLDTWLFTDGYPAATSAPLENFRAELVNRDIHSSFAVLQTVGGGACLSPGSTPELVLRQQQLQRQLVFMAGPAPSEPSDSIVPYLLTAQATGGQFLFVEEGQMDSAAEILQAQLSHNAGAGRWSDYVSVQPTYRYDKLPSWEYEWVDAITLGTAQPARPGGLGSEGHIDVALPQPFVFYERPATIAHVYENGYVTFDGEAGEVDDDGVALPNTTLPDAAAPNGALYPDRDELEWDFVTAAAEPNAPQAPPYGTIYTHQDGDWFTILYDQYSSPTSGGIVEIFEVLLNTVTGEIRYQYDNVANGVAGATIGLEGWSDLNPMNGVQVSFNDTNAAASDMGYRFTPVPPQPSKSYSVTVDSTMESIGFLLTGYDGTLAPMTIQAPDGTVACNTAGVLCVNVGSVQYVQVNVNGRTGLWHVQVQPGASGAGTYSFTSMAAGPLAVSSPSNHTLPSFGTSIFTIFLGQAVDGNQVDGYFMTPSNLPFGSPFALFDDGTHGDGQAGDGQFGSNPVETQEIGTAYLWLEGTLNGAPFQRVETKPYSFQPILLKGPASASSFEAKTGISFTLTNNDSVAHTFDIDVQVPASWRGQLDLCWRWNGDGWPRDFPDLPDRHLDGGHRSGGFGPTERHDRNRQCSSR